MVEALTWSLNYWHRQTCRNHLFPFFWIFLFVFYAVPLQSFYRLAGQFRMFLVILQSK
jgi:hypothetical protein